MASPIGVASWDFSTGPARFFSLPFASLTTFATRRLLMSPDYPAARLDMCERRRLPPVRRLWLLLPSSARLPNGRCPKCGGGVAPPGDASRAMRPALVFKREAASEIRRYFIGPL